MKWREGRWRIEFEEESVRREAQRGRIIEGKENII